MLTYRHSYEEETCVDFCRAVNCSLIMMDTVMPVSVLCTATGEYRYGVDCWLKEKKYVYLCVYAHMLSPGKPVNQLKTQAVTNLIADEPQSASVVH